MAFGPTAGTLEYTRFSRGVFNTFDGDLAARLLAQGLIVLDKTQVQVIPLRQALEEQVGDRVIDFMSVDVEGLDLQVLQSGDLEKWRPRLICCEARTPPLKAAHSPIVQFLAANGHRLVAHTGKDVFLLDQRPNSSRRAAAG